MRGKLVRGAYRVVCVAVKRRAAKRARRRNPSDVPAIGSEWLLDGRPVIVLAHAAEGKVAAHYQDVPPWDPDTRATRPDEFTFVHASRLTKANPRRRPSRDPANAGIEREIAELRKIVARLERVKRATRRAMSPGAPPKRSQLASNPKRRRRRNPGATQVYPRLKAIEAYKPDGKLYRHDFRKPGPRVLGTKSGSLRIPKRDARLWEFR